MIKHVKLFPADFKPVSHDKFGLLSVATINGECWYRTKEIRRVLQVDRMSDVFSSRDDDLRRIAEVTCKDGSVVNYQLVNQAGLYVMILNSAFLTKESKKFRIRLVNQFNGGSNSG